MNQSNKGFILLPALFLLTLFYSCSRDNIEAEQVQRSTLRMNMSIDNSFQQDFTAIPEELQINEVLFMFYDKESEDYLGYATPKVLDNNSTIEFEIPNFLEPKTSYKVLIAANLLSYIKEDSYDSFVKEYASLSYSSMQFSMAATVLDENRVVAPLPFSGKLIGANLEESLFYFDTNSSKVNVSVQFSRGVARFDLQCLAPNLEIKWVKVANYRDQVFLHSEYIGGEIISKVDPKGTLPVGCVEVPYEEGKPQLVKGGLYAFPNYVRYITPNDRSTTCLLIYGSYNNLPPTYYRINIGYDKGMQRLRPNHLYKITINRVDNNGAETESEALYDSNLNIEYSINECWDEESKLEVDDKGNFLGLSSNYVLLGFNLNQREEIKVNTRLGAKWKVEFVENSNDQFCEIIDKTSTSFVIRTKETNLSSAFRNNHLVVRVEGSELKQEVIVTQLAIEDHIETVFYSLPLDKTDSKIPQSIASQGQVLKLQLEIAEEIAEDKCEWRVTNYESLESYVVIDKLRGESGETVNFIFPRNITGLPRTGEFYIQAYANDKPIGKSIIFWTTQGVIE